MHQMLLNINETMGQHFTAFLQASALWMLKPKLHGLASQSATNHSPLAVAKKLFGSHSQLRGAAHDCQGCCRPKPQLSTDCSRP